MFHRIRVLHYNFEDYIKKYPLSKNKINECIEWIVKYIDTCYYVKEVEINKEFIEKKKQEKKELEYDLIDFGLKYKLMDMKEGFGRRKKYTTKEVLEVIGPNWINKYLTSMLKILTYYLLNHFKDKVKDKSKLYLINKSYGIEKSEIDDNEKVDFIYYEK